MNDKRPTAFIKIVELPAARVVSFHAKDSTTPEEDAFQMLEAWGKPRGIFEDPTLFQIFGFNNPWGREGELRGYEFWVVIPDDYAPGDDAVVKHFSGGKYSMATSVGVGNIGRAVSMLHDWVAKSDKYDLAYPPDFDPQKEPMLDLEQIVSPPEVPADEFRMDYYVPIADKQ